MGPRAGVSSPARCSSTCSERSSRRDQVSKAWPTNQVQAMSFQPDGGAGSPKHVILPNGPPTVGQKHPSLQRLAWQPNWQPSVPMWNDKRRHPPTKSPGQRATSTFLDTPNETTDQKVGGSTPSERTQESPGQRGCPGPASDAQRARWSHRWSHPQAHHPVGAIHSFPCYYVTELDFRKVRPPARVSVPLPAAWEGLGGATRGATVKPGCSS